MKTTTILEAIKNNKSLQKNIGSLSHYNDEQFLEDAKYYINAIGERRMINSIYSVSKSGMSRNIKFLSCEKSSQKGQFYYRNYYCFFVALGFSKSRNAEHYFSISGCGMDMIFHTNYTIIHQLKSLGVVDIKKCETLCRMTPTTI